MLAVSDAPVGIKRKGTLKWFNVAKGFGFIIPDEGTKDVFLHQKTLNDCGISFMIDGVKLRYIAAQNPKRPEGSIATWVEVVK